MDVVQICEGICDCSECGGCGLFINIKEEFLADDKDCLDGQISKFLYKFVQDSDAFASNCEFVVHARALACEMMCVSLPTLELSLAHEHIME